MIGLYKFNFSAGRQGNLEGLFIRDSKDVEFLINSGYEIDFGEALGKHSEIYGPIEHGDLQLIANDPHVIEIFREHKIEVGFNPFHYMICYSDEHEEFNEMTVDEIIKLKNETKN